MMRCFRILVLGLLACFTDWQSAFAEGCAVRIFLIGDSTCATKDLSGQNPERGWGQLFEPLFDTTVTVENHAANGRSTRSFRSEGRWMAVCEKLQPGDYVFIQFGHNDPKPDTLRYATSVEYAENLRRYVREARQKRAIPVLLTPIVRRNFSNDVLTDTHGDYLAAMKRVAFEEHALLIDSEALTRKWIAALGDEASKNCFVWVEPGICPLYPKGRQDDTHLNVRGARSVARMIAGELQKEIPELGKHLDIPDLVVAKDGSGDFLTLAEAITAIPDFGRDTTRIVVCSGVYREKIAIPATKRNVVLEARGEVVVTWNDFASKPGATGLPLGTSGSATVYFGGDNWLVRGMTFENTAGRVGQAVAVQCIGTNLHFVGCRFLGNQDTLYLYGVGNRDGETIAENSRLFFEDCYIEGTTDFIFGSASALFRRCEIRSKSDSYITAASTCLGQLCGLVFVECRLTAGEDVRACWLGRPWRDYAQTVFVDCWLGGHIRPEGWHDWNKPHAHKTAYYAEFGSRGPGADTKMRVVWARRLTTEKARKIIQIFQTKR